MFQRLLWFAIGLIVAGLTATVLFLLKERHTIPPGATVPPTIDGSANSAPPTTLSLSISQIQGAGEQTPYSGRAIELTGVITYLEESSTGVRRIFLQDTAPGPEGASKGIVCFFPVRIPMELEVGQTATISGRASEYTPEQGAYPQTQVLIRLASQIKPGSSGTLPEPIILDLTPLASIATKDALKFYEPYESMLVRLPSPRVLDSGLNWARRRPELTVCPNELDASGWNSVGGLTVVPISKRSSNWESRFDHDYNAERVGIENQGKDSIDVSRTGAILEDVVGVLDFSSGHPLILPSKPVKIVSEVKTPKLSSSLKPGNGELSIASYNLWNISANDTDRIKKLSTQIIDELGCPDLIGLSEVQDDSSASNSVADRTLEATKFANLLREHFKAAGKNYEYVDIAPDPHMEGGIPGGNIRTAFFFNTDKLLVIEKSRIPGPRDSVSSHLAFEASRKALVVEFETKTQNQRFVAIVNHLKSKRGDDSVWLKSPFYETERQRTKQALVLINAVERLKQSGKPVIMMGDFNDYAKSPPLRVLTESGLLKNLTESLPLEEQFSHRYQGNFACLDHILVSPELANGAKCEILHLNSPVLERKEHLSDHDPVLAIVPIHSIDFAVDAGTSLMAFSDEFHQLPIQQLADDSFATSEAAARASLKAAEPTLRDFAQLISPAASQLLEPMAKRSQELTKQRFGKVMRFFAPLYLSNECVNNCKYCGFSRDNPILRVTLSIDEVVKEARELKAQGFRNILLVSGEHPKFASNGYIADCISALREEIPGIALEVGPMETDDYRAMVNAGAETLVVYQETYEKGVYGEVHTAGPKKHFDWRLDTPERAYEAGFRRLGIGALYGLADWRFEALAVAAHTLYLQKHCWKSQFTISLPRLRPHAGEFEPLTDISDRELVQLICAMRILLPDVGIVLSTREPAKFRDGLIPLGITHVSAGSHTEPGGYTGAGNDNLHLTKRGRIEELPPEIMATKACSGPTNATGQFDIADERSPSEVANLVRRLGYEPVWKDWDASLIGS